MAKVFIGIALVFMLATAGIGFVLKGNIDKLQSTLTTTKGRVTTAEAATKTAKADAEKAQKAEKEAKDAADAAKQLADMKTKEAEDNKKAADELKVVVDGKDKEIAALNEKLKGLPPGVNPEEIAKKDAQIAEAMTAKQNAEKEAAEQKQLFENAVAKGKANEEQVAELRKEKRKWESNFQKPGIQGRVLAVNAGWNFVVLSVGDKQGVVVNATLLVVRGNEPIARLRVTSVEPTTSIADVLPGTVRRGTAIQPGDTVIFEGTRSQTPQVPKSPEAPANPPLAPASPALPNS